MSKLPWKWRANEGASPAELDRLRDVSPIALPQIYIDLLTAANGYEGALSVDPLWLVLYPANEVVEIAQSGTFKEFFPDFFVIGGNGGGEAIAFDARPGRDGSLIYFDMTNIDLDESVQELASNFEELLSSIEAL